MEVLKLEREFEFESYGYTLKQKDCGRIYLEVGELVSFITPSGKAHDVACTEWGFYATQSTNSRLKNNGFRTALIKNSLDRYYIAVVDTEKMREFHNYMVKYGCIVEQWLDGYD